MGRFKPEVIKQNKDLLEMIDRIADENKATSAQIDLAWGMAQKDYKVPIPGTRKLHRLDENIKAMHITLSSNDLLEINESLNQIDIDKTHF